MSTSLDSYCVKPADANRRCAMPDSYEIPSLTGERVALRPIEPEEETVTHRWSLESDLLTQTCRPPVLRSLARAGRDRARRRPDATRGSLAVILRGTGTLIGRVTYFDLNFRNRSAEIGYLLAPAARGKGFGREAVALLLGYLFGGLGLNKVCAQTASINAASTKLLEALGFQRDGVLRQHHLHEGALHDDFIYSILLSEWRKRGADGGS
jgi:RimJ/RimL family protein N-acetyltransferase